MSDDTNHQDDDDGGIAGLRAAARTGQAAIAENAALKRELLFAKAGIDIDTKIGSMLFKTWEGDDLAALKAEAIEVGALSTPGATPPPADPARTNEDAQRVAAQDALAGAKPGAGGDDEGANPIHAAMEGYQLAIKNGTEPDDARIDALAQVMAAGARGDRRVFFDVEAHAAAAAEADKMDARRR